jgi:hypothetical protein
MIWDSNALEGLKKKLDHIDPIDSIKNSISVLDIQSKELSKILLDISKATFFLAPLESSVSKPYALYLS